MNASDKPTGKPAKYILDGKHMREQDVTQTDVDRAMHLVDGSLADGDERIDFGFTKAGELEKWVGKQSQKEQQAYHVLQKMLARTRKQSDISEKELFEIQQKQVERVRRKTEQFAATLEKHNITEIAREQLEPILDDFDPLYGSHSMFLFRWPNYDLSHSNASIVIDTGAHPNLNWFRFGGWFGLSKGWNNRTTSYISPWGCFVMAKDTWFRGGRYWRLSPKWQPQMSSRWDNNLESIAYASYYSILVALI